MKRYLLDTNAAGHFINRRRGVRQRGMIAVSQGHRLGIGTPVLGELWFGVDNSASRDRNIPILVAAVSDWTVWPYDTAAAREYGRIAAELKRIGRPMQQIDMMIAAIAKSLNSCIIVTADQDLFAVPGLTIENWESTT